MRETARETTVKLEVIGVSQVVKFWGDTMNQIDHGVTLLLTRNSNESLNGTLRPRAVFMPPDFYRSFASQRGMTPDFTDRVAASTLRASWANTIRNIIHDESRGKTRHVVVAHKMQDSYDRKFKYTNGKTAVLPQPASDGTERAVLVGVNWYAKCLGVDPEIFVSEDRLSATGLLSATV